MKKTILATAMAALLASGAAMAGGFSYDKSGNVDVSGSAGLGVAVGGACLSANASTTTTNNITAGPGANISLNRTDWSVGLASFNTYASVDNCVSCVDQPDAVAGNAEAGGVLRADVASGTEELQLTIGLDDSNSSVVSKGTSDANASGRRARVKSLSGAGYFDLSGAYHKGKAP